MIEEATTGQSSCSSQISETIKKRPEKRPKYDVEALILQNLQATNDEEDLFGSYIARTLKRLDREVRIKAKLQIQQVGR